MSWMARIQFPVVTVIFTFFATSERFEAYKASHTAHRGTLPCGKTPTILRSGNRNVWSPHQVKFHFRNVITHHSLFIITFSGLLFCSFVKFELPTAMKMSISDRLDSNAVWTHGYVHTNQTRICREYVVPKIWYLLSRPYSVITHLTIDIHIIDILSLHPVTCLLPLCKWMKCDLLNLLPMSDAAGTAQ